MVGLDGCNKRQFQVPQAEQQLQGMKQSAAQWLKTKRTHDKNDYEVYWTDATWRSGHGGDLKWCIIGGFLVVKGMWNNTGETGVQIASVPAAPKYRTYINAPTIGSYGGARTTLGNDGVITVDGMNANNNSSVSRIEILFVIPVESRG
jgi:hypothetical protein